MKKMIFIIILYLIVSSTIYSSNFQLSINLVGNQTYYMLNNPVVKYELSYLGLGFNVNIYAGEKIGWFNELSVLYDWLLLRNDELGNQDFNSIDPKIFPIDFDILTGVGYKFDFNDFGIILGIGIHINFLYLYDNDNKSQSKSYLQLGTGAHGSIYFNSKNGFLYRIGFDLSYDPFAFATNVPGFKEEFGGGFSFLIFTGFGYKNN